MQDFYTDSFNSAEYSTKERQDSTFGLNHLQLDFSMLNHQPAWYGENVPYEPVVPEMHETIIPTCNPANITPGFEHHLHPLSTGSLTPAFEQAPSSSQSQFSEGPTTPIQTPLHIAAGSPISVRSFNIGSESESINRSPISRVTRACDCCRRRKLRCNAVITTLDDGDTTVPPGSNIPLKVSEACTRCIAAKVPCEYTQIQKKRGPHTHNHRIAKSHGRASSLHDSDIIRIKEKQLRSVASTPSFKASGVKGSKGRPKSLQMAADPQLIPTLGSAVSNNSFLSGSNWNESSTRVSPIAPYFFTPKDAQAHAKRTRVGVDTVSQYDWSTVQLPTALPDFSTL